MKATRKDTTTTTTRKKCESLGVDFVRATLSMLDISAPEPRDSAIGALEDFVRACQKLDLDAEEKNAREGTAVVGETVCSWFIQGVHTELDRRVIEKPKTAEGNHDALGITDVINRKISQASAIFKLMGEPHRDLPDDTLANAAWAGRDLMKEAGALVGELHAKSVPAAGGAA